MQTSLDEQCEHCFRLAGAGGKYNRCRLVVAS